MPGQNKPEFNIRTAAAEAADRGVTLMVKSLEAPHYTVPYPVFAEEVRQRKRDYLGSTAVAATPCGHQMVACSEGLGTEEYRRI